MDQKTCFVISPIGEDGSAVRQAADDLFDLVLEPSLTKLGFAVVRADHIPGSGVITSEVIDLVQAADLCVIDLSGHNANVFYECGRRHETGKPFVQMIAKGEQIPFDLAGIRTIFFDLSAPRSVRQAADELERFVAEFEQQGYDAPQSGSSLSSLSSAVFRLEGKLDRVLGGRGATYPLPSEGAAGGSLESLLKNPQTAMIEALHTGNLPEASRLLPRIESLLGISAEPTMWAAGVLASAGDQSAVQLLIRLLESNAASLEPDVLRSVVGAAVQFYLITDRETEGVEVLLPHIDRLLDDLDLSAEDRAGMLNQKQRLLYGAGAYEAALGPAEETVDLNPAEASYWYNLSGLHEALDDLPAAAEAVDEYMKRKPAAELEADQLGQAVDIYAKVGRDDEALAAYGTLQEVSPLHATIVAQYAAVRKLLSK